MGTKRITNEQLLDAIQARPHDCIQQETINEMKETNLQLREFLVRYDADKKQNDENDQILHGKNRDGKGLILDMEQAKKDLKAYDKIKWAVILVIVTNIALDLYNVLSNPTVAQALTQVR